MGSLISSGLSLDCKLSPKTWRPKTIGGFLAELSGIDSPSEKLLKLDDFVSRLQDELKKIEAFKRELPLCMILLNDAIAAMKDEFLFCKKTQTQPFLEEFIPLKNSDSNEEKDEQIEGGRENDAIITKDKMSWMSSVQLWNPENQQDHYLNSDCSNKKPTFRLNDDKKGNEDELERSVMNGLFQTGKSRTVGRAFIPFKGSVDFPLFTVGKEDRDESERVPGLTLGMPEIKNPMDEINSGGFSSKSCSSRSGSSSATNGNSNLKSGQQQTARKQRRCWSPELHRRFIGALQQLGGAQAATPKQIRDFMQVDGLTNDEVKSHLQKYRLHTRRAPTATNASTAQPVVFGGLWMSQDQCGEYMKQSNTQSGSPQGPLQLTGSSRATTMTAGDSIEDEDDEKSESQSCKSHHHMYLSGREDV